MLTLKCWGICSKEHVDDARSKTETPKQKQKTKQESTAALQRVRTRVDQHELTGKGWGNDLVSRALKSQNLWLSLTYLGLILLMARTYA